MKVGGRRELIIPLRTRLRKDRLAADDPAELDARVRGRPARHLGQHSRRPSARGPSAARAGRSVRAAVLLLAVRRSRSAAAAARAPRAPPREHLEREDLLIVTRALRSAEPAVAREVHASKAAWPLVANGLPPDTSTIDTRSDHGRDPGLGRGQAPGSVPAARRGRPDRPRIAAREPVSELQRAQQQRLAADRRVDRRRSSEERPPLPASPARTSLCTSRASTTATSTSPRSASSWNSATASSAARPPSVPL